MLEYQNVKMFLQKVTFQISPEKFLQLKHLKILSCGQSSLMFLMEKKLLEKIAKKKKSQHEFRIEKVIKRKDDKLYVKWKGYYSSFNSWIDKRHMV